MIYEEAAKETTVTGWACITCGRFYGNDGGAERAARWCHATDLPCERCGGRNLNKSYTCCASCLIEKDAERWNAMPEAEWDGKVALNVWGDDKYFFYAAEILDYLEDAERDDGEPLKLEDLRLVLCEQVEPRRFEFADFFCDDLAECHADEDYSKIDDIVNAILRKDFPITWQPTQTRASLRSLMKETGMKAVAA